MAGIKCLACAVLLGCARASAGVDVVCASQWAQSDTEVHIFTRFAHDSESPASGTVEVVQVDFEPQALRMQAVEVGGKKRRFWYDIELYRPYDKAKSRWKKGPYGVGFTLRKQPSLLPGLPQFDIRALFPWAEDVPQFDFQAEPGFPIQF